jgi:hypothetical protein
MQNKWQCLILLEIGWISLGWISLGWISLVVVELHYNACYVVRTAPCKSSLC